MFKTVSIPCPCSSLTPWGWSCFCIFCVWRGRRLVYHDLSVENVRGGIRIPMSLWIIASSWVVQLLYLVPNAHLRFKPFPPMVLVAQLRWPVFCRLAFGLGACNHYFWLCCNLHLRRRRADLQRCEDIQAGLWPGFHAQRKLSWH